MREALHQLSAEGFVVSGSATRRPGRDVRRPHAGRDLRSPDRARADRGSACSRTDDSPSRRTIRTHPGEDGARNLSPVEWVHLDWEFHDSLLRVCRAGVSPENASRLCGDRWSRTCDWTLPRSGRLNSDDGSTAGFSRHVCERTRRRPGATSLPISGGPSGDLSSISAGIPKSRKGNRSAKPCRYGRGVLRAKSGPDCPESRRGGSWMPSTPSSVPPGRSSVRGDTSNQTRCQREREDGARAFQKRRTQDGEG